MVENKLTPTRKFIFFTPPNISEKVRDRALMDVNFPLVDSLVHSLWKMKGKIREGTND